MHPGGDAHVVDVPVVVGEDAVPSVHGGVQEDVEALVLRRGARDPVRIDHEVERSEALGHAEQLLARLVHRPLVRRMEGRHHLLEHRLEAVPRKRPDQPLRIHHLARPGVVDVDEVPYGGLARAQAVDRIRVGGEALGPDSGVELATERIEHLVGVVAFPAVDVQLLVAGRVGRLRQQPGRGGRPESGLLQEVSPVHPVLEHDRSPLVVVSTLPRAARPSPILPAGRRPAGVQAPTSRHRPPRASERFSWRNAS